MKKNQHITVLVSNDLEFDQRVSKVCTTLHSMGFELTLAGRKLSTSKPFERPYEIVRFSLPFTKGAFFYAALTIRFFFFLLFKKTDILVANDLDTLLPAYLIHKLRGKKLVYDSHEYFTEAEGLTGRNFQKKVWLAIERWIFPKLKNVYTVNESIATIYRDLYKVDVKVVRNIPLLSLSDSILPRSELGIPTDKKMILLQGAFIDPDRGGKELVEAMHLLPDVLLMIIGSGREIGELKQIASTTSLNDRVFFKDRMPFNELRKFTANADLGISLDKPLHLNYTLSLPNKLFDYIHSGTPVLVSNLPELRKIVNTYKVGMICPDVNPETIAKCIREALNHPDYFQWRKNCIEARNVLNWQTEEKTIRQIYSTFL